MSPSSSSSPPRFFSSKLQRSDSQAGRFIAALKECARSKDLDRGKQIHAEAEGCGLDSDAFVASSLVNLYGKCGSMADARRVFDRMNCPDLVAWNSLILGYAENGHGGIALQLFLDMESRGLEGNSITFIGLLKACSSLAAKEDGKVTEDLDSLEKGMALHSLAAARGLDTNVSVTSSLVEMYARCGSMVDAWKAFQGAPKRDVVVWTALMLGFVENGQNEVVLELFVEMQREDSGANARTFVAVFQAITSLAKKERGEETSDGRILKVKSLERGMAFHSQALRITNHRLDIFLHSCLIQMYATCGSMDDALGMFSTIFQPNQVCWTALILGYVENGQAETALRSFLLMQLEGCFPDVWTLVCVLKACGSSVALRLGRIIHEEITSLGFQFKGAVISSLVDFYSRCGSMDEAEVVFNSVSRKDAVTWSSLIAGYSRQGDSDRVIQLFEKMCDEGVKPDGVTYVSVLTTCSRAGMIEQGKKFFQEMRSRCGLDPGIEHYHCVIDMLGRAKQLEEALEMVEAMPFEATMVTWTSLLAACSKWQNAKVGRIACDKIIALEKEKSSFSSQS